MKKLLLYSFIVALISLVGCITTKEQPKLQDVIGEEFIQKVCEQYIALQQGIEIGGDYNADYDSEYDSWYSMDFFLVTNKSEKTKYEHSVELAVRNMSKRLLLYKNAIKNGDTTKADHYLEEYRSYEKELADLLYVIRDSYICVQVVLEEIEN